MALFGDAQLPATSAQQSNVGGIATGFALPTLTTGFAGQQSLADILTSLGGTNVAAGTGGVSNVQSILTSLGLTQEQMAPILQQMGLGAEQAGLATQTVGQGIETTGALPSTADPFFATQLNDQIQSIKGKYASLGMSGSTAEQQEITDAQNRSAASRFQLAEQLGGQLAGQGIQTAGVGANIFGQGTNLTQLGLGALTTGGSLATTLAELGMQGFNLSLSDITNIANEGLSSLGVAGGTYSDLTRQQLAADSELTSVIGSMFKGLGSLGGDAGLFGGAGLIPGGKSFLSGLLPS